MTNKELALKILENIGDENNIANLTHCATRLRFNLKDNKKANLKILDSLEGVLKAQIKSGQLQIVIGAKVKAIYEEISKLTNLSDTDISVSEKKKVSFDTIIETVAGIFSPCVPVLIGCGMIKSLSAILVNFNLVNSNSGFMTTINMIGDLVFYFLPFFLALSAAKKFKTHQYLALALAASYMYPTLSDGAKAVAETGIKSLDFLGLPILFVNYKATVIPIIISVWILSFVYRKVDNLIPEFLRVILTPMIVLLIMIPLQLIIVGPLGSYIGVWLAQFIQNFYEVGGIFAAFILGFIRPVLVMFGMHYALTPIQIQQVAELGNTTLLISSLTANFAQAGAALGVFLIAKNKTLKTTASSATVSAFFGVSEPAIYGVNLKYKKPFFIALLSSGIAAAFLSLFNATATAYVPPSVFTLPVFIADKFIYIIIGIVLAVSVSCILTMIIGIKEESLDDISKADEDNTKKDFNGSYYDNGAELKVLTPLKGYIKELSNVEDPVFSQGIMGKGIAIQPTEGKVYAPFDGKVDALFNTKHAIGVKSDNGVEVLIHIGIDTVNLEGKYFTAHVKQGDIIKANDLLIEFDIESIKKEGYEVITPVIVTNHDLYKELNITDKKTIEKNELLIELK